MLRNLPKLVIGSSQLSNDFPVTAIGNSVVITFDNDNQDVVVVSTFKNKTISR